MIEFDPIAEYLRYKYNDKSIFILEEILGNVWYETIIHYGNGDGESFYEIITYDKLDIFERSYKLKKIKEKINDN